MAYNFASHLKEKYKEALEYGIRYQVSTEYNDKIRHPENEDLPDWYKEQIASLEGDLLNGEIKESVFVQTDDFWGFRRYRNGRNEYSSSFTNGFYEGIINARISFINYALSNINVIPNSIEKSDEEIIAKGANQERITLSKQTRGTGDKEEILVCINDENKSVKFSNISSLYTTRHIIEGKPDVYEDSILSICETHGCVYTPNGLYIFSGNYRKKDETENAYYPNFDIKFYNRETIDMLISDLYNVDGRNSIREELDKTNNLNSTFIQYLIEQSGMQPDGHSSIFCTNYDLITNAKMIYSNPEMFIEQNIEMVEQTQHTI